MKGIGDVLILGGVAAAGYLLLQSGEGGGGGTVQYIRSIPRAISPEVKEAPPAPTIIQFPSETVNFPAPKLPSVTSLLPPMPTIKTEPVTKTQPVANTPKKIRKTTGVTKTETVNYGVSKTGEMATTAELKKQKKKLEGTPMAEYFERVGHGGKVTVSSKKSLPKDWSKGSPYWEQAMKEPERFSERSVWDVAKKIESKKKTTTKKSSSLKSVGYRSRASFVRSFGW